MQTLARKNVYDVHYQLPEIIDILDRVLVFGTKNHTCARSEYGRGRTLVFPNREIFSRTNAN